MKVFSKIAVLLKLNCKLFFSNRLAVSLLAAVTFVFVIVSGGLVKEYDKKASLPIGVIDEDQSELSKQVISKLKEIEGFTIYEWDKQTLKKELEKESIYAYFDIGKGFEQKVKENETKGIVTMYYLYDYKFVSILSDIFVKSMMKEVVLYRGNKLYEQYVSSYQLTNTVEYIPYIEQNTTEDTQGIFESSYYKVNNGNLEESIETKNSVLSNQIFIGMVAIFGSFLAMFLVMCLRKTKAVRKRMRISLLSCAVQELGDLVTLLVMESLFGLLTTFYLCSLLGIKGIEQGKNVFLSFLLFMCILSFVFSILSKLVEKETTYQLLGALVIFLIGGLSIMASIGQITIPLISEIAKFIPNYWFITDITDIILAGKATIRLFPVGVLAGLVFIYTGITDIKLKVLAR